MYGIHGKNVPKIQILQDIGKGLYSSLMSKLTAIEKLHQSTCDRKENGYIDPKTGFYVLSAHYLRIAVTVAAQVAGIALIRLKNRPVQVVKRSPTHQKTTHPLT